MGWGWETLRMLIPEMTASRVFPSHITEDVEVKVHALVMLSNSGPEMKLYVEERNTHDFSQYSDLSIWLVWGESRTKVNYLPQKFSQRILKYFQQEKLLSAFYANIGLQFDCRYFVSFMNDAPIIPSADDFLCNYNMKKILNPEEQEFWDTLFMAKEAWSNTIDIQMPQENVKIKNYSSHFAICIWNGVYISKVWLGATHVMLLPELLKLYESPDLFYTISPKESSRMDFDSMIPFTKNGKFCFTQKYKKDLYLSRNK